MSRRVLRVTCPDQTGLIHAVTGVLLRRGLNIVANGEFVDHESGSFFMRAEVEGELDAGSVTRELASALPAGVVVELLPLEEPRIVVMATKEYHCLGDLLLRHAHRDLYAAIVAVVASRDDLAPLAARFGIPFHTVGVEGRAPEEQEADVLRALELQAPDYVVLAKYMRVLGPSVLERFPGRIINIHHSFLPAFVGSQPYRQASERGVKIIGATAHFVTEALDDGPIIAQSVIPVDHADTPSEMARAGRDVERTVLASALRLVFEGRVFLCGRRTVVLS